VQHPSCFVVGSNRLFSTISFQVSFSLALDLTPSIIPGTQSAVHGNDYELIPTVKKESQHSVGGGVGWPIGHEFPRLCNHFGDIAA